MKHTTSDFEYVRLESTQQDRKGQDLPRYCVNYQGKFLGVVERVVTHSYRKAGRLRTKDFYPLRWAAFLPGPQLFAANRGFESDTREVAAKVLLREFSRP